MVFAPEELDVYRRDCLLIAFAPWERHVCFAPNIALLRSAGASVERKLYRAPPEQRAEVLEALVNYSGERETNKL